MPGRSRPILLLTLTLVLGGCGAGSPTTLAPNPTEATWRAQPDRPVQQSELVGAATWYGKKHHGRQTASGEPFDMHDWTAAHKTLPFNTVVRVTDQETLKSVVVRINDRGPYRKGRIIDLSRAAASDLDALRRGVVHVELAILHWGDGKRVHAKYRSRYGR